MYGANSVLTMRENDASRQDHNGDFDSRDGLSIQYDCIGKRMVVCPRIDSLAAKDAALQFTTALDEAVDSRCPDVLVFDLSGQLAVASSVLSTFVRYHRKGIEVHLLDPTDYVLETLTHTKLIQFFHVNRRSGDQAIGSVRDQIR
jgi:hypothetical protein